MRTLLAICLLAVSASAHAQCPEDKFLVSDIENITLTDEVKTAFLHVATKEQYEQATSGGKLKFGMGSLNADLSYEQAKTGALKEASLRKYEYDRNYYLRYLTQKMSPTGVNAYEKCLEFGLKTTGLRLWLGKKDASFYFVKGFWVGQDTGKSEGGLEGTPVVRGFQAVQIPPLPTTWVKGHVYEILLEKEPNVNGILSFSVGGQQANLVVVRDLPIVEMATAPVLSKEFVSISSGGSSDPKHPVLEPREKRSCVHPSQPGRSLLPGSYSLSEHLVVGDRSRATAIVVKDTPEEICYQFNTSTGCKECTNSIEGRAAAMERFVVTK